MIQKNQAFRELVYRWLTDPLIPQPGLPTPFDTILAG